MHQSSPLAVLQQWAGYKAKATSQAVQGRKHDAAVSISTNACTYLARVEPL